MEKKYARRKLNIIVTGDFRMGSDGCFDSYFGYQLHHSFYGKAQSRRCCRYRCCGDDFAGILTQTTAVAGIDFNTLSLLIGMMIIVGIAEKSGMFQYVAIWATKK